NGDTSHCGVGEDLLDRISELCCRIRRGKMSSRAWIHVTDPRQDTEISKVAHQVLSPIAGTNTGNFVSGHDGHALRLLVRRMNEYPVICFTIAYSFNDLYINTSANYEKPHEG